MNRFLIGIDVDIIVLPAPLPTARGGKELENSPSGER
jgi:hypothetical protein